MEWENPDINTCIYSQLVFDNKPRTHTGERIVSSTNGGITEYPHVKNEIRLLSHTICKSKPKLN
jgi:hypothetical protein